MTDAQTAVHTSPARGRGVVRRFAVRLLLTTGLAGCAWLLGALLAGTASAATPSFHSPSGDSQAEPAQRGLLGGVLNTVVDSLNEPADAALWPVHDAIEPLRQVSAGEPILTISGAPAPERHHASILPTTPGEDAARPAASAAKAAEAADTVRLVPEQTFAGSAPPAEPAESAREGDRPGGQRVATMPDRELIVTPAEHRNMQARTGDDGTGDPDNQPEQPQPVPPAPSLTCGCAHGNFGGERELAYLQPNIGTNYEEVSIATAGGQHLDRVAAARGLPAVSPD